MKTIVSVILMLLITASMAFAVSQVVPTIPQSDISRTPGNMLNQAPVQVFAPNGLGNYTQGVASTTFNLSNNLMYAVYSGSGTCMLRQMATNANGAYVAVLVPNAAWHIRAKNYATPFVNLSGCVGAYVQIQ